MKLAIALAVIAACDRRAPIASCNQDLSGTYLSEGKRWIVQDHGDTLEAFPLFADVPTSGDLEIAPRVIDLVRLDDGISGVVRRRYMRGSAQCHAKIPARITACAADALDILLADPVRPLQFEGPITAEPAADEPEPVEEPGVRRIEVFELAFTWKLCTFPRPDANRRERWIHE